MPSNENTTYSPEDESPESLIKLRDSLQKWFSGEMARESWRKNMLESACLFQFKKTADTTLPGRVQNAMSALLEEDK